MVSTPTAVPDRAEGLRFGHRWRALEAETEYAAFAKGSEHLSSRLAAIANRVVHATWREAWFESMISPEGANTGAEQPSSVLQVVEFKSSGFSRSARAQLERLCRDALVIRDALGTPSTRWLVCDTVMQGAASFADPPDWGQNLRPLVSRLLSSESEEPARSGVVSTDDEYPEWQWIERNEAWLQRHYAGLWIAVVGNSIVAVGKTAGEVFEYTEQFEKPFIYHVPSEDEPTVVATS